MSDRQHNRTHQSESKTILSAITTETRRSLEWWRQEKFSLSVAAFGLITVLAAMYVALYSGVNGYYDAVYPAIAMMAIQTAATVALVTLVDRRNPRESVEVGQ